MDVAQVTRGGKRLARRAMPVRPEGASFLRLLNPMSKWLTMGDMEWGAMGGRPWQGMSQWWGCHGDHGQ